MVSGIIENIVAPILIYGGMVVVFIFIFYPLIKPPRDEDRR